MAKIKIQQQDAQKKQDTLDLTEKIRKYVLGAVSTDRYNHCVSTAGQAAAICRITGQNVYSGYLAGLSHDMAREMSPELLLSLASRDGRAISTFEKKDATRFLHGRAAAVILQESFGVLDPYILQAVSYHVLGGAFLCPLALVIYVADKTEPTRKRITPQYTKELMACPSLNFMAKKVVEESIAYDKVKKRKTAPDTLEFLDFLQKQTALEINAGVVSQ